MFKTSLFFLNLLLLFPLSLWAEDEVEYPQLVITGTKNPRLLENVPVRTEVIGQVEIEKMHASNLAEALAYVPGVQLKPIHGKSGTGVWLQGYDANRVLILVDGNPVAASTGSSVDITQIAIGDVQQIEIVKGAVSALYGSSAMGGVVNVITRKPDAKYSAHLQQTAGSWGNQDIQQDNLSAKQHSQLGLSTQQENWSAQFFVDSRISDGFKADPDSDSTQGWKGHKTNLSGKLQFDLNKDTRFTLMPRLYEEDATTIKDGGAKSNNDKIDLTSTQHLSAIFEHSLLNGSQLKFRGMWERYENDARQDFLSTSLVDQKRLSTIAHNEFGVQLDQPMGNHLLTLGLDAKNSSLNVELHKPYEASPQDYRVEVDDKSAKTLEFYIQDSWFIGEQLEILPGARVNQHSTYGEHLSPMINAMFHTHNWLPGRLNIRAGLGNGYREPNLKELHYFFDHSHLGYVVLGNEDLKPESSFSYQAGMEWLVEIFRMEVSVFYNQIKNLIASVEDTEAAERLSQELNTPVTAHIYQNYEKARTQGGELTLSIPVSPWLTSRIGYAYLDTQDEITKKELVQQPAHDIKLGFDASLPWDIELSLMGKYESSQFSDTQNLKSSPEYYQWDFKFNHQITDSFSWFAGVNNLTGVQREFTGSDFRPIEGRYLYTGLRWKPSTD